MSPVPERITKFIKKHHLLSLATIGDDGLWCFSCFYKYIPEENIFIITSDYNTRHIHNIINKSNQVAGTIALETKIIGKIRGIQFTGEINKLNGEKLAKAKAAYSKRFPVSKLLEATYWSITPAMFKMTDNRLGFGKKLYWTPE